VHVLQSKLQGYGTKPEAVLVQYHMIQDIDRKVTTEILGFISRLFCTIDGTVYSEPVLEVFSARIEWIRSGTRTHTPVLWNLPVRCLSIFAGNRAN
jgi:hypothetical protein